jgi:hypothetical protein
VKGKEMEMDDKQNGIRWFRKKLKKISFLVVEGLLWNLPQGLIIPLKISLFSANALRRNLNEILMMRLKYS